MFVQKLSCIKLRIGWYAGIIGLNFVRLKSAHSRAHSRAQIKYPLFLKVSIVKII